MASMLASPCIIVAGTLAAMARRKNHT